MTKISRKLKNIDKNCNKKWMISLVNSNNNKENKNNKNNNKA